MIMDNNEKAFESYTGTEVFQILLDGNSSRSVLDLSLIHISEPTRP